MDIELARRNMIESQVRTWDVLDQAVLDALEAVPREHFVPANFRSLAFSDCNIPLGHDEVMMTPRVEARMLQALAIKPGDRALEIGTGSGFIAAMLGRLADSVTSIDIHPDFVAAARDKLSACGVSNATLKDADGARGYFDGGPWDVIACTGALAIFDPHLADMLADDGRMFIIVGQAPVMEARLLTRISATGFTQQVLFETELPLLKGVPMPDPFRF